MQIAYNNIFATSTTATNATVSASNNIVAISNNTAAASAGVLSSSNMALTASNTAVAASATTAATAAASSAGVVTGAAAGMSSGVTALIAPITTLATTMGTLALSSGAVAANMGIIALSTGLYSLEAALASLTSTMLSASFGMLAATSKLAAKGVAELAIANAANSAAQIPFVGWTMAPGAALTTGAAIMAAGTLVQFRENGGPVEKGKPYIVGEKRPELFVPDRNGTILPDTSALSGGGDTINQYSLNAPVTVVATDAKSFEGRIDELTDRIHSNLFKKIQRRKLPALA